MWNIGQFKWQFSLVRCCLLALLSFLSCSNQFLAIPLAHAQDEDSSSDGTPFHPLRPDYQKLFTIGKFEGLSGNVAFSAKVDGYYRLFALDFDSGRIRKLIDGPGNNSYPSWSPDGEQLSFTSDRDGNNEIYIARWDGQKQTRLTENSVGDDNADWSPDGSSLVYYSETGPAGNHASEANLFTMRLKDRKPIQITKLSKRNTTPRWSPDGSLIAFSTNRFWPGWDVCIWKVASRKEDCILSGASSYCRASFDPKGKSLAYSAGAFSNVDLAQITLATKEITDLTDLSGKEYDVVWSPDGTNLIFSAENGRKDLYNVFLMKPGGKPTPLISSDSSIRYLSWTASKTFDLEAKRIREEHE